MDEATKEGLRHAAKALENITDVFNKLAGPLAEEVGLTLGDKAREYRLNNAIKIFHRVKKMLADAGIAPNEIPPRLFLPIVEAASLEDDESIQEKWAALLANASGSLDSVTPSYVEVLKELTPEEVRFLDWLYADLTTLRTGFFPQTGTRIRRRTGSEGIDVGSARDFGLRYVGSDLSRFNDLFRNDDFLLMIDDLVRMGILRRIDTREFLKQAIDRVKSASSERGLTSALQDLDYKLSRGDYWLTPFGFSFLAACHAPVVGEVMPDEKS